MSLKDLKEGLHDQGYDKEEAYFRKKEMELLEKIRRQKEEAEKTAVQD